MFLGSTIWFVHKNVPFLTFFTGPDEHPEYGEFLNMFRGQIKPCLGVITIKQINTAITVGTHP